jgi:hypothetical protein
MLRRVSLHLLVHVRKTQSGHASTARCRSPQPHRRSGVPGLWHPSNIAAVSTTPTAWSGIAAAVHAALVAIWRWWCACWAIERVVARRTVRGVTSGSPCVEREERSEVKSEEHEQRIAEGGSTGGCKQSFRAVTGVY